MLWSILSHETISTETAKKWLDLGSLDHINILVNSGWIQRHINEEEVCFSIHPVIISVLNYKLHPDINKCKSLLSRITVEIYLKEEQETVKQKLSFLPHAEEAYKYFAETRQPILINLSYNIGVLKKELGDYDIALCYLSEAKMLNLYNESNDYKSLILINKDLGLTHIEKGSYDIALNIFKEALVICDRYPENGEVEASILSDIGLVYAYKDESNLSLKYFKRALKQHIDVVGESNLTAIRMLNNLGFSYNELGEYSRALQYHEKALHICKNILKNSNNPDLARTYIYIAMSYRDIANESKCTEKMDAAVVYLNKALEIKLDIYGDDHIKTSNVYDNLGGVYKDLGKPKKALKFYKKALAICEKRNGERHPYTAISYTNIGTVYHELGDYLTAINYHNKAIDILSSTLGKLHQYTKVARKNKKKSEESLSSSHIEV